MRYFRVLASVAGLCWLSACAGPNHIGSNKVGAAVETNSSSPVATHSVSSAISSGPRAAAVHSVADTTTASTGGKLIALTFDDGPRPYVLFGSKESNRGPGLVDILDQNGVKATFFVVGWRLTPRTWGEPKHEEDIGVTCIDAAEQLVRRGHELEDHTYSHLELRSAEKRNGV